MVVNLVNKNSLRPYKKNKIHNLLNYHTPNQVKFYISSTKQKLRYNNKYNYKTSHHFITKSPQQINIQKNSNPMQNRAMNYYLSLTNENPS